MNGATRPAVLVWVAVLAATGAAYLGTGTGFPSKPLTTRHDTCTANLPAELSQGFEMACRSLAVHFSYRMLDTGAKMLAVQKNTFELSVIKQTLKTACEADKKAATKRLGEMLQEQIDAQNSQTSPSPGLAPSPPSLFSGVSAQVSDQIFNCKEQFLEQCNIVLEEFKADISKQAADISKQAELFVEDIGNRVYKGNRVYQAWERAFPQSPAESAPGIGPNKGSKDAGGGDAEVTLPSERGDMQKLGFTPKKAEPATPPAA